MQTAQPPAPPKSQFMTPRSSDFNSATRKSRVERGGEAQREWEGICWHRAALASLGCRRGREGRRRRTDFILRGRRRRSGVIKTASGQWAGLVQRSARSLLRPPSDSIQPAAALRMVHNAFNARPLASRSLRVSQKKQVPKSNSFLPDENIA